MEDQQPAIPIGSTGRLEAFPLSNAVGNHAVLLREADTPRALLTGEPGGGSRERVILVPLDDDVELRIDGDAMAVWLTQGSVGASRAAVPAWASAIGVVILLAVIGFTLLGSFTFFSWLFGALGWI